MLSIKDIKPGDCSDELRTRIEKVAAAKNISWEQAVVFLAQKVVSP